MCIGSTQIFHSNYVESDEAKKVPEEVVVQLTTAPALDIASEDRLI